MTRAVDLLHVEDNPGDARLVAELLAESPSLDASITHVWTLRAGLEQMLDGSYDAALVDLSLPDARDRETLEAVAALADRLPIVILTGRHDGEMGAEAVRIGAQEYLHKGGLEPEHLARTLLYAMERHALLTELQKASFVDAPTGTYNRRGISIFGMQLLRFAERVGTITAVVTTEITNLAEINEAHGRVAGNRALLDTSEALRSVCRESDLLGRSAGDRFTVLGLVGCEQEAARLKTRLDLALLELENRPDRPFRVRCRSALVLHGPETTPRIESLLPPRGDVEPGTGSYAR